MKQIEKLKKEKEKMTKDVDEMDTRLKEVIHSSCWHQSLAQ